jgi:ankyrin repeat protein
MRQSCMILRSSRARWKQGIVIACSCFTFGCSSPPQNLNEMDAKALFSDPLVRQLVLAAEKGDVKAIDDFVKKGVDVNAKGRHNVTPLLRSLLAKNKEGFASLLKHGADPNSLDDRGTAVMNWAAMEADSFWLAQALKHGGKPNLVNVGNRYSPGDTPMIYAVLEQRTENAKLLIAAGADVNHKNKAGQVLLVRAGERPAYGIVYALLEAGADYHQKDLNGLDLVRFISGRNEESIPPFYREEQAPWYFKTVEWLRKKGEKVEIRGEKEKGKAEANAKGSG